jgi:hypothetical protein
LPHTSNQVEIRVGSRTFGHVSGEPPYFLRVPEKKQIFFVTSGPDYVKKLHLVNIETGADVEIQSESGTLFWGAYDTESRSEKPGYDYLRSASDTEIVLVHAGDPMEVTVLDLVASKVKSRTIQK